MEACTKLQHPLYVVLKLSRGYWRCWHAAYAQQTQGQMAYLLSNAEKLTCLLQQAGSSLLCILHQRMYFDSLTDVVGPN